MTKDLDHVAEGKAMLATREYAGVVRVCREGLLALQNRRKSKAKLDLEIELRLMLGQALAALGRWRELLVETDILIASSSKLASVWRLRGQAMLSGEDFTGAGDCLGRAQQLDPKDPAIEHLLAELAIAKSASVRSFSVNELTENAAANTEDHGTLPTAPEIAVAGRKLSQATSPDGGTLTTSVGPSDRSREGSEVPTGMDIEVASDPAIRVDISGKPSSSPRTPVPVLRSRGRDEHEETVPIPYSDGLPEERTDIRHSASGDPPISAEWKVTGAAETTVVPPELPPPPSPPPPALAESALYGRDTRTDLDAGRLRRRRRWIWIFAILAVAAIVAYALLRWRVAASGDGASRVSRAEVLALAAQGSSVAFEAALAKVALDPVPLVALSVRLRAEAAFWYGTERPNDDPALLTLAAAGDRDALDALCWLAIGRGDRHNAHRYSAEYERQIGDPRSRYAVGMTLLLEGKPTEAAATLRRVAEEAKYPLALLGWARAEVRVGRIAEARTAFGAAEAAAPQILLIRTEAVRAEIHAAGRASDPAWLQRLAISTGASQGEKARARLVEAELYIARQDLDDARRALLAAMTLSSPQDVAFGAELGAALAAVGDLDAAEPLARRAFAGGAPRGRLILSDVVQRRGRFEEALTLLAGDDSPEGRVAKAESELGLGRPTAARSEIEGALALSPGLVSALVVLSKIQIVEGRADEARARLERLASADPTGTAAALAARLWLRAGVQERARALVADAVLAQPMSADVQLAVAELALFAGDGSKASRALQLSTSLAVGSSTMRQERATLAAALGDFGRAADQLATISARAAAVEGARYRLLLGDADRAGVELDRAMTLSGTQSDAEAEARARWLLLVRPASQIIGDVAALSLGPLAATVRVRAKLLQSDWVGAERELAGLHPTLETRYLSSRLGVERGRNGVAAVLEKLLKLADREHKRVLRAEILTLLGRIHFEKGASSKSVNYLDEAVALYPGSAEAHLYLGLATQELGDRLRARNALDEAARLPPRLVEAEYYLGRLLATDDPVTAKPHLERYLEEAPKGPFAEDVRLLLRKL